MTCYNICQNPACGQQFVCTYVGFDKTRFCSDACEQAVISPPSPTPPTTAPARDLRAADEIEREHRTHMELLRTEGDAAWHVRQPPTAAREPEHHDAGATKGTDMQDQLLSDAWFEHYFDDWATTAQVAPLRLVCQGRGCTTTARWIFMDDDGEQVTHLCDSHAQTDALPELTRCYRAPSQGSH